LGSEALVDATLLLLATASVTPHAYYHLLSGMDLPLRSQDEIHAFFAKAEHAEFVDFKAETVSADLLRDRLQTYHFLQSARQRYPLVRKLDDLSLRLQSLLQVNRLKCCTVRFQKGSQCFPLRRRSRSIVCARRQIPPLLSVFEMFDEFDHPNAVAEFAVFGKPFFPANTTQHATCGSSIGIANQSSPYVFPSEATTDTTGGMLLRGNLTNAWMPKSSSHQKPYPIDRLLLITDSQTHKNGRGRFLLFSFLFMPRYGIPTRNQQREHAQPAERGTIMPFIPTANFTLSSMPRGDHTSPNKSENPLFITGRSV
jgi:hypothetical protein